MTKLKLIVVWVLRLLLAVLFAIQGFIKAGSQAWISRFRGRGSLERPKSVQGTRSRDECDTPNWLAAKVLMTSGNPERVPWL